MARPYASVRRLRNELRAMGVLRRAGMLGAASPRQLAAMAKAVRSYGPVGAAPTIAAIKHGSHRALVDELGAITFADLDRRSNALAAAWAARGVGEGTSVGVLCRNHRFLLDATFACAKGGMKAIFLNTDFAPAQASEVCTREGVQALVHDEEFAEAADAIRPARGAFVAWCDTDGTNGERIPDLVAEGDPAARPAPRTPGALIVLTSGTTGTPKGAQRPQPRSLLAPGAVVSKVPWRSGQSVYVAPPMFHGLGFMGAFLTIGVGSTVVTSRRFEPAVVARTLVAERCAGIVLVPVMLRRLLDLGDELRALDLSALEFVLSGGAPLDASLAAEAAAALGEVVHNFYGSTEVAYATIATPQDLRDAPGCVGRPPLGTTVSIIGDDDAELQQGETGRIFVGNGLGFEGYTGGGGKDIIGGLVATGDVGHFDRGGRLFIDGRDDDMILSGGENVFPQEVESLLLAHPAVADAVVLGVADDEFGHRLRAFVVCRDGAALDAEGVRAHVAERLARFKVPRDVCFVDALPRNATGKVVKRLLPVQP